MTQQELYLIFIAVDTLIEQIMKETGLEYYIRAEVGGVFALFVKQKDAPKRIFAHEDIGHISSFLKGVYGGIKGL